MENGSSRIFEFGSFQLDVTSQILRRSGCRISLAPKLIQTLCVLVENSGQLVEKNVLLEKVWPDSYVEEGNLARHISQLRKILQGGDAPVRIETIPKRGYLFVGEVRETLINAGSNEDTGHFLPKVETDPGRSLMHSELPTNAKQSHEGTALRRWTGLVTLIASLVVALIAVKAHRVQTPILDSIALAKPSFSRVTTSGSARLATISPDGRYIAYIAEENGRDALYLMQVATRSVLAITRTAGTVCCSVSFSPDSTYIYYVAEAKPDHTYRELYRVPLLGGTAVRIVRDVDGPVGISPDGHVAAFRRYNPRSGESLLTVADVENGNERVLSARKSPEFYAGAPAWSADGREIALAISTMRGLSGRVAVISAHGSAAEKQIVATDALRFERLAALPDSSGWIATATEKSGAVQLWLLSRDGKLRRVTNDLSSYLDFAVTKDAARVVAVTEQSSASLFITRGGGDALHPITSPVDFAPDASQILWTHKGKIIFTSRHNGTAGLWMMDADGGNAHQITEVDGTYSSPAVTPDGRMLVLVIDKGKGSNIWRMDIDGSDPIQLTIGNSDYGPQVSPDGKWVIFYSRRTSMPTLWKVPLGGGRETQVRAGYSICPAVSPDGRYIAFGVLGPSHSMQVGIMPLQGGELLKTFPISTPWTLAWTPDSKSLTYIDPEGKGARVWIQRVDGGAPSALAEYDKAQILAYAFAPNGRQIAVVTRTSVSDVVMIGLR